MRGRAGLHAILVVVQACFASLAVAGKLALERIPADAIVLARVAGGAAVFWLLARRAGAFTLPSRRDFGIIASCAVLGVVGNQLLFIHGLERTTAVNSSVIGSTIPLATLALAIAVGRERPSAARVLGIVVGLAGTLVLVEVDRFRWSDRTSLGNMMVLANALSYAAFLVLVRGVAGRMAPLALVAVMFLVATPLVVPLGVPAWVVSAGAFRASDLALVAFIIAVPTVGAYALNHVALRHAAPSLVASYVYLQPLFATLGAVLLLGERPGPRALGGGALILLGLVIGTRAPIAVPPTPVRARP